MTSSDEQVPPESLGQIEGDIEQVSGDGAYDQRQCYDAIREGKARATIPPRRGAKIWKHGNAQGERHNRDDNLRRIRKVGRKVWKQESDYHRRSLAETTMFRFKTIFEFLQRFVGGMLEIVAGEAAQGRFRIRRS